MLLQPFTPEERRDILARINKLMREHDRLMKRVNEEGSEELFDQASQLFDQARELERDYFDRLPRIPLSCCPYDHKPLVRTFDPYGLDGPWWEPDATPEESPPCTHFCVLRGALNYNGNRPVAGRREVHPGPEVPYVIPRLLEMPGMVAVIGRVEMANGYIAYPIAYFAEKRPPVQELVPDWPRTILTYETQLGERGWKTDEDPWDFDLKPWLQSGKLKWCPPDSGNTTISDEPPEKCPYLDLPGRRVRIVVQGNQSWEAGLPGPILHDMTDD